MKASKFINCIAEIKIKLDRGNALVGWGKNILLLAAAIKIIFPMIGYGLLSLFCGLAIVGIYFIGLIDLKFIKLFQREQVLSTSKYNPHLNRLKLLSKARKI